MGPKTSIGVKWALISILWLVVGLRFWAIRKLKYPIISPRGLSDLCIGTLTLLGTFYCVAATYVLAQIINMKAAAGNYVIPTALVQKTLIVTSVASLAYLITLWLVKIAFVVIYFEFSEILPKRTRWLLYGTAVLVGVSWVYVLVINILWCQPVTRRWSIGPDFCNSFTAISPVLQTVIANIVTDLLLMVTAFAIIRWIYVRTKMHKNEFRAVWFMMAIGSMTITIAVARLVVILVYSKWYDEDAMSSGLISLLTEIEAVMAGCAACLPAMRTLFRKKVQNCYREKSNGPEWAPL
ncbi:hypothetical protein BDZ91DRAFT_823337 [Kalaharituber pfeilii]|nr:hypothetical protein BDZ91DRAFT_823337 [Kalaharituber pfeilii]